MLLASYPRRHSPTLPYHYQLNNHSSANLSTATYTSSQSWYPPYSTPITPAPTTYDLNHCDTNYNLLPLAADQSTLVDYNTSHQPSSTDDLRVRLHSSFDSSQDHDLMQSEQGVTTGSWHFSNGQLTPTSARPHHRESSLSSLGSAGPASPYNHNTSHPQVVLASDSVSDVYYDGLPPPDYTSYQNNAKSLTPTHLQDTYVQHGLQSNLGLPSYGAIPYHTAIMAMHNKQHASGDDDALHPPEYIHSGRPSVASSHDSPATPPAPEEYEDQNRKLAGYRHTSTIPKLDRTMSDAYNDELYNPDFTFTSAPSSNPTSTMLSPSQQSGIFSQRLQAANNHHLSATSQATLDQSRGRSPFRQGSPLAPPVSTFDNTQTSSQIRLGSEARLREQQRVKNEARVLQEQMERSSDPSTPKTISPKDALLEYHETDEDAAMPLFPPQSTPQYGTHSNMKQETHSEFDDVASLQSFRSMATSRRESSTAYSSSQATPQVGQNYNFAPPAVSGGMQIPQQYPFISQQRRQSSNLSGMTERNPEFPSTLASLDSSSSEYVPQSSAEPKKPLGAGADTGTYTCTYHGCTLRFETPAKLQKHKREGHRQSVGAGTNVSGSPGGMTAVAQTQNGPHRCDRISPTTGKPCNVVFSRPYDLTRHEDTIHNARKQKVRCHICTEEKTFSRNDALTRHFRVVHPEIQLAGKTRRRAHD